MNEIYSFIISTVIPISTLITAIVATITIYYLKKQSKITENAFKSTKNASEISAFITLQKDFDLNKTMVEVRRAIATGKPVLESEGGPINENDFNSYIEFVNRFLYYSNLDVIDERNIIAAFGAPIMEIEKNKHVMKYIKDIQEKYGKSMLSGITDLIEKTKKARSNLIDE